MQLAEFYFHDPRLDLIPIEHLTAQGMQPAFAALLLAGERWSPARLDLFNQAFRLYWSRASALAARTPTWPAPRLRHVAVVADPYAVRPYAQLLNTSCWTLYACDFEADTSSIELAAYLFAHGDRLALTGEVTASALHHAAYWFDRNPRELDDFRHGAQRSTRPDASGMRAIAAALEWLPSLYHARLRPPPEGIHCESLRGSEVLVPRNLLPQPPQLMEAWRRSATAALDQFRNHWRSNDTSEATRLLDWLAAEKPPLLITGKNERVLWAPDQGDRLGPLRNELRGSSAVALRAIADDLRCVAAKTRMFHAALKDPQALPQPHPDTLQSGYSYLQRERAMIAYNLHDPAFERLQGPGLPYGRAMLGARTIHEWCHLAVDAGWVPQTVSGNAVVELVDTVARQFDAIVATAPEPLRRTCQMDLRRLQEGPPVAASAGTALARIVAGRLSDYQGNLLAWRFLNVVERETYVRHNIRTLRDQYVPSQLWRMLARYITEYQYLGLSLVDRPQDYLFRSTWFEQDFITSRALSIEQFMELDGAVKRLCASFAVDENHFGRA